ncbi:MAG: hypothetical protein H6740_15175 [Alphaproteobacteria bacterium]|nr:hypothetical protein [Alphaproteobacteria bacterium]
MSLINLTAALGFLALTATPAALLLLGMGFVFTPSVPERRVHQIVGGGLSVALAATLAVAGLSLLLSEPVAVHLGSVLAIRGYHLSLNFLLDPPALVLLTMSFGLCGLVGMFSARYLHQDEGYGRFYLLLLVLAIGVSLIASAEALDLLFAGWELVGLSSALLIAFFHRRPGPVVHGLWAYAIYRSTDVGLLLGLVLLHHLAGSNAFASFGSLEVLAPWSWVLGALLVFGAMGKGATVPFTGWLPRAMEGPTPSSAIFYGALSIHASPFLLLRIEPLLDLHVGLRVAVVTLGLITAAHASMVGRVQADIKSTLGYASVAQVGLMWVWAGLGLETLTLVHMLGHASVRTWQLLRAPNLLHDRHELVNLLGSDPAHSPRNIERRYPSGLRRWLYLWAMERWYLDELLLGTLRLALAPFRAVERLDQRWIGALDAHDAPAQTPEVAK